MALSGVSYTPGSYATNHDVLASEFATEITTPWTNVQTAWGSVAPVFAGGVTAGNGVLTQWGRQVGKTIEVRGSIVLGSTSSFTASVVVQFPIQISSNYTLHTALGGGGIFWDNSAAVPYPLNMEVVSLTTSGVGSFAFAVPAGGTVNSTLPVVAAVNDVLSWSYTMEAA